MMKNVVAFPIFLALSFGAAAVGSRFMPGEWYAALAKPAWNPPSWVFAPVWTVLYVLIGVSAWMVWRRAGLAGAAVPLAAWLAQLALNAAWSWVFFGLHRPGTAFAEIVVLWLAIVITVVLFWQTTRPAGILLLPYLLWVSFAAVLNWTLWRLNG